ncbi:MAG: dihydrodipicolinate synthase family protein [Pseudonocardia sp.]
MTAPTGLRGVVPPVCTPFTADLEIDVPSLRRLVDHLIDGGVDGLFVLGSTSEVAYLPDAQRRLVTETVVERVGGRVPVLAGAIDMTTPRVCEHAVDAVKDGADGVVVTAPFYTRTHPAEIERHFRLLADRVQAPIYAYDLPVSVHVKLDGGMLLRLAADGVLAGLKDSSGDDGALRRLLVGRRDLGAAAARFAVLTGSELTVDAALAMGVDGVVPGLGNVDPGGYARLYRLCRAGDWVAARREQERLLRAFGIVEVADGARMGGSSAALGAFKAALHLLGVIDDPITAPPQVPLNAAEVACIGEILDAAGLAPRS